jgi:hypothetical protein
MKEKFYFYDKQVVIKSNRGICQNSEELLKSNLFKNVLQKFLRYLKKKDSPYRVFNQTVKELNHLVRKTYRNICENVTGDHPRIYRQVPARCQVGQLISYRVKRIEVKRCRGTMYRAHRCLRWWLV